MSPKLVWYIAKHQNDRTFYVSEIDEDNHAVTWRTNQKQAMNFYTERGVHQFINAFLNGRTDMFLINAPSLK